MKIRVFLPFAMALTGTANATNYATCFNKAANVASAIWDFCAKTNIMVPSDYASMGKMNGDAFVTILGSCKPKEWVPQDVCREQFYEMCAAGDHLGNSRNTIG